MAAYSLFVSQTHASKPCREERKNAEYKPFNSPQPQIVGLLLPLELVILFTLRYAQSYIQHIEKKQISFLTLRQHTKTHKHCVIKGKIPLVRCLFVQ